MFCAFFFFLVFSRMTKLPLPSGISWLCHLCAPNCGRVSRIVHAGMCRHARDWQLGAQCACVCVCVSKETLLVVKYGQVPVSCFVFFFFFFVAEVHVAKCPRRQTTLSLSLDCILSIHFFFFLLHRCLRTKLYFRTLRQHHSLRQLF